jgi:uncharacterized protein (TIGR02246 family)
MKRFWFHRLAVPSVLAALAVLTTFSLIRAPRSAEGAGNLSPRDDDKPKATATGLSATDDKAIRQASAAYMAVLNKGDLEGVMVFWSPDADYVDEAGKMTRGRDAIAALFKKSLSEQKGAKFKGQIHSLKLLRNEIALVDGSVEITSPDGTRDTNRYAVVWVKSGDKWLISSARDLPTEIDHLPSLAYAHLQGLEWLIGDWVDQSDKVDVDISCRWAPNKTFLIMEYFVKREKEDPLVVTQRIGWDPYNQLIRSWTFDSRGGFNEGYWRRDGAPWIVGVSGILPDGGTGSATHIYDFVNQDAFTWRSMDREIDGQPVADSEVKFVRKATKEGGKP